MGMDRLCTWGMDQLWAAAIHIFLSYNIAIQYGWSAFPLSIRGMWNNGQPGIPCVGTAEKSTNVPGTAKISFKSRLSTCFPQSWSYIEASHIQLFNAVSISFCWWRIWLFPKSPKSGLRLRTQEYLLPGVPATRMVQVPIWKNMSIFNVNRYSNDPGLNIALICFDYVDIDPEPSRTPFSWVFGINHPLLSSLPPKYLHKLLFLYVLTFMKSVGIVQRRAVLSWSYLQSQHPTIIAWEFAKLRVVVPACHLPGNSAATSQNARTPAGLQNSNCLTQNSVAIDDCNMYISQYTMY